MTLWLCNKIFIKTATHCSPLPQPACSCRNPRSEMPEHRAGRKAHQRRLKGNLATDPPVWWFPVNNTEHPPAGSAEVGDLWAAGLPAGSVFFCCWIASAARPPPQLRFSVEGCSTQSCCLHFPQLWEVTVSRCLGHAVCGTGVWFLAGAEKILFFCEVLTCHSN